MPKRVAVGTSLGLFSRSAGKALARFGKNAAKASQIIRSAAIETLEDRLLLSRSWFVAPWGNNGGAGTQSQPFQTIQQAANLANGGDTVQIMAGTYHESVRPAHSGVTFEAFQGQSVTVTGADNITNFTQYSGNVWRAYDPINLGNGNNQIFADGQALTEARYPNTQSLSWQTEAVASGVSGGTIYSSALNQGSNYWAGSTIHITPGQGWTSYSGTVNSSGPGWINVSLPSLGSYEYPSSGTRFYLTGKYQMLDGPGEWYRDNSGYLYVRMPNSDNPNWHTVQAKARNYAFDLSNVSSTTLYNLNIFGATVHTGWSSSNTVLNHLNVNYPVQVGWISNGWSVPGTRGMELYGSNSVLENSNIANSASDGVYVVGNNVRVQNNLIHDVDTAGIDAAGITIHGYGDVVDHNTVYDTGRDGILIQTPATVTNNVVHDAMLQTTDGGGIYAVSLNGQGSQIAGNYVYNVNAGGYGAAGIFLDNNCSNFVIHDNTTSNVQYGLKLNYSSVNEKVYSNRFGASKDSVTGNNSPGQPYNWSGSQFYNNVYYSALYMGYGYSQWSNSTAWGSPSAPSTGSSTVQASPAPSTPATPPPTTSSSSGSSSSSSSSSSSTSTTFSGSTFNSNGGSASYNVNFGSAASSLQASVSLNSGQQIAFRLDSPTGKTIGTIYGRGGWSTQTIGLSGASGTHKLYATFVGSGSATLAWFKISGATSAAASSTPTTSSSSSSSTSSSTGTPATRQIPGLTLSSNGVYEYFSNLNFGSGLGTFQASVSLKSGSQLVLHLDSSTGQTIGTLYGRGGWATQTIGVTKVSGTHTVYADLVGSGPATIGWIKFS